MTETRTIAEPTKMAKSTPLTRYIRYEHLVAGVCGGVMSSLILHPFDLLKVRFQVNDGSGRGHMYRGLADGVKSIVRNDGWRGLYQGVTPNVWGSGSAWGLYFFSYNILKAWMQGNSDKPLGAEKHLFAGTVAGISTLSVTNPIWVVKTRMCLQMSGHVTGNGTTTPVLQYKGMLDALFKLWKHEGVAGLYKGYLPGIIGVSHGALQFMAYEELKKGYSQFFGTPIDKKLNSLEYLVMASLSKIFAATTTYPYQVVRSRLQNQYTSGQYKGSVDVIQKILRNEGVRGFYKGLVPGVLRVTPACAVTFVVYENMVHYLKSRANVN